jgi:hypothetical protein
MKGVVLCATALSVVALAYFEVGAMAPQAQHIDARQDCFQDRVSPAINETQKQQIEDLQIQQMAVQTMAVMASNLIQIGADPYNPRVVGPGIANIIGNFVNFVVTAMRHPELIDFIQNEEFQQTIRSCVDKALDKQLTDVGDCTLNEEKKDDEQIQNN